jgi:hypothetical protein
MERKRITLSGINRSDPDSLVPDGAAMEIINLRPKDEAFRPVGTKKSWLAEAGDVAYLHEIDERYMAAIFYDSTGETWSYTVYDDGVKGSSYAIAGGDIEQLRAVSSLNNTLLLVLDDSGDLVPLKLVFDRDTEKYRVFTGLPDLPLFAVSSEAVTGDNWESWPTQSATITDIPEQIYAAVLKQIADKADTYYSGPLLLMFAWEMADGTEVKQSVPLRWIGSMLDIDTVNYKVKWNAYKVKLSCFASTSDLDTIATTYKDIVSSLNIYITKMRTPKSGVLEYLANGDIKISALCPTFTTITAESLADETLFYLLKKVPLKELSKTFTTEGYVLEGPFGSLASNSSLTVNQNSHHLISGNNLFSYNSRIFLSNTRTKLFKGFNLDGYIIPPVPSYLGVTGGNSYYLGAEIDIDTSEGLKTVFSGWSSAVNYYMDNSQYNFILFRLRNFYGYPDSRATIMRLFYKNSSGAIYLFRTFTATKVEGFNYCVFPETARNMGTYLNMMTATPLSGINDTYTDTNRVQTTALDNIFSYPAENSYRIGNGEVLGLSTNAIALSSGQFGEYPLYAFTSEGVWTMRTGDGATLINTVRPLSRDICDNPASILQIDGGTIFKTAKGLMMVAGAQVIELSEKAEGNYKNNIRELGNYKEALSDPLISGIHGYLCATDILTYLSGASLSYDHIEEEIICSNPQHPYSWVFSLKYKAWHKISEVFAGFVAKFPKNFGKKFEGGNTILYDLTAEEYNDDIPVLYETREMKIIGAGYKKIARSLVGCQLEHNDIDYRVTAQLYGSPDNLKWFRLSASNAFGNASDIVLGRSLFSCRRYICLITGKVKEGSYFTHIEADLEPRYSDKLR